jgi:hypothetical protein
MNNRDVWIAYAAFCIGLLIGATGMLISIELGG